MDDSIHAPVDLSYVYELMVTIICAFFSHLPNQPSPAMQMHSPMPGGVVGLPPQPGAGGPPQQPGGPPQPPYPVGIAMGQHPMMGPQ